MNAHITGSEIDYSMADVADLVAIRAMLSQNGLPHEDVSCHLPNIVVARREGGVVGTAALELYGTSALLRSVCVQQQYRSLGVATRLCDLASAQARKMGVTHLYLLTTTASRFFEARGFRRCARDSVPAPIAATQEFLTLCPASAICLSVQLSH